MQERRLPKVRELAELAGLQEAKARAVYQLVSSLRATQTPTRRVVNPPNLSRPLTRIGLLMLASPEPFSYPVAIPLLAAASVLNKRKSIGLANITEEARRVLKILRGS